MQKQSDKMWKIVVFLSVFFMLLWAIFNNNCIMQEKNVETQFTKDDNSILLGYDKNKITITPEIAVTNNAESWYVNIVGIDRNGASIVLGNSVTYRADFQQDSITIIPKDATLFDVLDKIILDIVFVNVPCMQTIELDLKKANNIIDVGDMKLKVNRIQCNESDCIIEFVPWTNEKDETILYFESPQLIKQELYEKEGEEVLVVTLKSESLIADMLFFEIQGISFKSENWVFDI